MFYEDQARKVFCEVLCRAFPALVKSEVALLMFSLDEGERVIFSGLSYVLYDEMSRTFLCFSINKPLIFWSGNSYMKALYLIIIMNNARSSTQ